MLRNEASTMLKRLIGTAILSLALAGAPAQAFRLKDVVKDVGNIAKEVVKLPNPITTPIQIITGNQNPLKPGDYIKQQGQAVGSIVESTRNISNVPHNAAVKVISEVAGDKAVIAYELLTGTDRLQREFSFSAAQSGANVLQGQDPLVALAMPLAAAIRDARSKYDAQAQPLPAEVKAILGQVIPPDVLDRARYVTGEVKFALPAFIQKASSDTAVTLDDVIVFPRSLDFNSVTDLAWVAHEVFHVKQYKDWGIDQFAFNYLKNYRAVEDQANAAQSFALSFLQQINKRQPLNPQISYKSVAAFAAQSIETPLGATTVFVATEVTGDKPNLPTDVSTQQPVYKNNGPKLAAYCLLYNEPLFIDVNNVVIAPMRGSVPFGQKIKPGLAPGCYFDLAFPGGRACGIEVSQVDPTTGQTLYGYEMWFGQSYAGRCVGCTPQYCGQ